MIEIKNVSKTYGTQLIIDDITLTLPAGGLTAVVGPNGAGKSTLLSLISRLSPLDQGHIFVDGLDVARHDTAELAKRLAILRQDNNVQMRLTVRDVVAFGRYPHSQGRLTQSDYEQIDRALAYLDLHPLADRLINELSGGQRQRVFIAMVICQDTDYVLLDEPLNNLDMKHASEIMKTLRRAADELDKTIVVVLHDINVAACYADLIVGMRDGKIAYVGSPNDFIEPSLLKSLYDIEVTVFDVAGRRLCVHY